MRIALAVAVGGALGAVCRHLIVGLIEAGGGLGFPLGTLAVNVAGCFLMGLLIEGTALAWSPSPEVRALVAVGLLGALTTFSAFSIDTVLLVEQGAVVAAGAYVVASVALSIAALYAGMGLLRRVLR